MTTQPVDIDDLFTLPVDEFVAARDGLVRRLKADGQIDRAASVKALRRPTLAAWAVNQVVRADEDAWEALVASGRTVQRAQRRALSGVRDSGLRDASTVRRGLVEALTDHATRILAEAGARPESHLDDVAATFESASADPAAAAIIGAARLSAPVHVTTDFSGTSALLAMSSASSPDGTDGTDADDDAVDRALAEQRREAMRAVEAARSRAEASATAARAAGTEATDVSARAERARAAATAAREAAERAAAEADDLAVAAGRAEEAANLAADGADRDAAAVLDARAILDDLA